MARQLSLSQLQQYVRDVEDHLDALDPPATKEEAAARETLARAAAKLKARTSAPISLAVVGEYTVGKSLLLGALLGRPDLLPVEERPATGNITVLRLEQGDAGSATVLADTSEIHFMTRERLASCVGEITEELVRLLDEQVPQLKAGQVLGGVDLVGGPQGWTPFLAWYRCLWGGQTPGLQYVPAELISSRFRDAALELLRIRDAEQGQHALLGGAPVRLDTGVVREVLELPVASVTPDTAPAPRRLTITREDVERGGTALADCFPLVERVEQTVRVSPDHWRLGDLLDGRDVQILDFPGVGAVGSFGRDRNLSRQALQDIHSILLVLPAHHLPSDIALDFWQMLAADGRSQEALGTAALLAANQFDRIVVPTAEGGQPGAGGGLGRVDSLNSLAAFAPKIIGQGDNREQIFLASAVTGLLLEQQPWDEASRQTKDVIRSVADRLSDIHRPSWHDFAARLEQQEPGSHWARRLLAYEEDGGLGAIREAVRRHLLRHGDAHRLERARAAQREVDQALRAHRRAAPRDEPPQAEAYREAGTRFRELRQLIGRILQDLALLDETDPRRLPEAPPPPDVDASRAAVRAAVYAAHWWEQLLQRALRSPDQLVPHAQPVERDPVFFPKRPRPRPTADDTVVFQQLFERVLADQRAQDLQQLESWLDDWRGYWADEMAPFREWLESDEESALLLPELYTRRMHDPEILDELLHGLDVDALVRHVAAQAPAFLESTAVDPGHAFPLQPGHALPWHAESDNGDRRTDERSRHPLAVLQMRAAVADAAADRVGAQLRGLLRRVFQVFRDTFDGVHESLLDQDAFRPTVNRPAAPRGAVESPAAREPDGEGRAATADDLIRKWLNGEQGSGEGS